MATIQHEGKTYFIWTREDPIDTVVRWKDGTEYTYYHSSYRGVMVKIDGQVVTKEGVPGEDFVTYHRVRSTGELVVSSRYVDENGRRRNRYIDNGRNYIYLWDLQTEPLPF